MNEVSPNGAKTPRSFRVETFLHLNKLVESVQEQISRSLSPFGLTPSQFGALEVLHVRGGVKQREIAESLMKTGGNITMVVDNLVKDGLVERTKSPLDRRQSIVELTPKGRVLIEEVGPVYSKAVESALSGLSDSDCDLIRGLTLG